MKTRILILILSVIIITGFFITCDKTNNIKNEVCQCEDISATISENKDLCHKWIFESFETLDGEKNIPPSNLEEMHLTFTDSLTITIKGQNNGCISKYEVFDNNCINLVSHFICIISNINCTEIGGTPEELEWETKYFNAIEEIECFKISENKLIIYYKHNNSYEIMNFVRE